MPRIHVSEDLYTHPHERNVQVISSVGSRRHPNPRRRQKTILTDMTLDTGMQGRCMVYANSNDKSPYKVRLLSHAHRPISRQAECRYVLLSGTACRRLTRQNDYAGYIFGELLLAGGWSLVKVGISFHNTEAARPPDCKNTNRLQQATIAEVALCPKTECLRRSATLAIRPLNHRIGPVVT